nr:MAG TPA: YjcQ protein [Caudoviricetes sp.]
MDNFVIIYKILKVLEAAMDYDEVDINDICAERFHISENRWQAILKMLVDNGYIEGIAIRRSADGYISIGVHYPRITLKGLEYLQEDTLMKRAYRLAKGIKDITPGI